MRQKGTADEGDCYPTLLGEIRLCERARVGTGMYCYMLAAGEGGAPTERYGRPHKW